MKITLITFLLSTLFYFSSPKTGLHSIDSNKGNPNDSLYVISSFPIKMGKVSDEYINEKRQKIDSFYNKNINSPYYSGSFIVVKNGRVIYEDYKGFANLKTGKKIDAQAAHLWTLNNGKAVAFQQYVDTKQLAEAAK